MNILQLIDIRHMCFPAYLYFFTFIISYLVSIGYYYSYKKNICITTKIDNKTVEACILDCTTFNYFYNFMIAIIITFVLNILCKFGSYVGYFIAFIIFIFTCIPVWYTTKILMNKTSKQKKVKC
jgi:hypothetical protein